MDDLAVGRGQVDATDFDVLIGPYLEAGYRVAVAMPGNPDDARDAVQEAAFKAWRKLRQLRPNTSDRPWFLAIVAGLINLMKQKLIQFNCSCGTLPRVQ